MIHHAERPYMFSINDWLHRHFYQLIHRRICSLAVPDAGARVLDLFCSDSALLRQIAAAADCNVCGIHPDITRSRQLRSSYPEADIIFAQPDDIPWHDCSFDLIVCRRPLNRLELPESVLAEVMRTLKPGGQFLIGCFSLPSFVRHLTAEFHVINVDDRSAPYTDTDALLSQMTWIGFESVARHTVGIGSAVISAWKPASAEGEPVLN